MKRRRARHGRVKRRARPVVAAVPEAVRIAEARLLTLARELTALVPRHSSAAVLPAALTLLADAYAPPASLARELYRAEITVNDETAALPIAWGREQVRLALQEILRHADRAGRGDGSEVETRAWVLMAACEALAHEPPSAAADRLRAIIAFSDAPGRRG